MLGTGWHSLRVKIIAWSFVPTTMILLAVALVTFYAYQQVTEDLVLGRNQELTRLSAGQLSADLAEHTGLLAGLARNPELYSLDSRTQQAALTRVRGQLAIFDAGAIIVDTVDTRGRVAAAEPPRPEVMGQDWSDRAYFRQMLRSNGPIFSDVVADGPGGTDVIVVAVPLTGSQGEFRGTLAGMFRLGSTSVSAFYGGIVKLRLGESGGMYVVDSGGRVIYHSDSDRIGQDFSSKPVVRQALERRGIYIPSGGTDGGDIVASFAPVPGTPWHLISEESWDALLSSSQGYRRFLMLLLALGVVVPALVVTIGVRRIMGPLAKLTRGAQEVAKGNFGRSIAVQTGDELEELAQQFNLMSAQLQESYAGLERKVAARTRELETLNAIAAVVSGSLNLQEILDAALEKTLEAMGVEAGAIHLLNERDGTLKVAAVRGIKSEILAGMDQLRVGRGFIGGVAQSAQPLVFSDVSADPSVTLEVATALESCSMAVVPLSSRGKVVGTLFAASPCCREFTPLDLQLLTSIGQQIGVALENARLHERAQQLAVVEERNRLARDLHDSVTQAVYGVTLYAEAAARLLLSGQVETAADHLRELRSTAQQALREMRSLIFELRPPALEKEGLVAALQARLEAVEMRAGIETELRIEGEGRPSAEVEEELYRIAQEALNNALRHAQPHRIRLHLHLNGGTSTLEIADDGTGFDLSTASDHGGLGLRGMAERAEQLGGRLTVDSKPGEGTTVRVTVGAR